MPALAVRARRYSGAVNWGPFDGSSTPSRRRLVVVAAAVSLALMGCGGGDHGHADVDVTPSGTKAFDPHRSAPAAPIKGAVNGGTVTVLIHEDFAHFGPDQEPSDTMDPTGNYFADTASILSGLVTRSLTQYVYDPASGAPVLVPDIATDLGTPNADFTEWTFTIRDGVRFEDGSRVSADDIAYGVKRSLDRADFPDSASYSTDYFLDGHSYKGPYLSGDDYAGVVVDGNTLTIKMARPFPDMPYWAAFPAIGPVRRLGSDPATYWRHPMATGPYKFGTYVPGKSLTLVRNDQWDPDTDPGRHDYPDRYVFDFHQVPDRSEAAMLGGSVRGRTSLSYDSVSTANRSRAQRKGQLTSGPGSCTYMLWPDNRKITDIRVREALGYAYPYRQLLGDTDLPGSTSLLPPGTLGREDYTVLDAQPGETNPHKARMLLRRAGHAPGDYPITFVYEADSPVATAVKDQRVKSLHAAGFAPHPIPAKTFADWSKIQNDPQAPINVRFAGLCSDWPSGSWWVPQFFGSDGGFNDGYFAEPSVDAAIGRISRLPLDQQPSAWGSLDEHIMTDYYPGVILGYSGVQMLHGADIGGMNDDRLYGTPTWRDIYVRHH
jgi:peptide/nickel transport system substrate-binding protein